MCQVLTCRSRLALSVSILQSHPDVSLEIQYAKDGSSGVVYPGETIVITEIWKEVPSVRFLFFSLPSFPSLRSFATRFLAVFDRLHERVKREGSLVGCCYPIEEILVGPQDHTA